MATYVENAGDLQAQVDEVEALSSIYGDEWCVIDEASRIFCIKISADLSLSKWTVCLQVRLSMQLRSEVFVPVSQEGGVWLWVRILCLSLKSCWDNAGESILYLWVEKIREFLVERSQTSDTVEGLEVRMSTEEWGGEEDDVAWGVPDCLELVSAMEQVQLCSEGVGDEETPPITHGQVITDRRSTFQPHLAPVVTSKQVTKVLDALYENKKIASATHNIYAYRYGMIGGLDRDGDGDGLATFHLLPCSHPHLSQILDVRNVMVVVSRWYGGILLGPDRFKHICNCARAILVQEGHVDPAVSNCFKKTA
uniref:Impact RWD domain protein n=1 Tax=Paramormyrops kingsleyae TaxID=1676925 RepID=A0A3B3TCM4_9TELE